MKFSIAITFFLTTFLSLGFAQENGRIVDVTQKASIERNQLLNKLASANIIVIGEKHYTKEVQEEEGHIISDVVNFTQNKNHFSLSWEFLNASSQSQTEALFKKVTAGELSSADFLFQTQGIQKASLYSPIIDVTAALGGELYGVNLSREEKAPVTKGGLEALDPKLLPPNFQLGGVNYLERFTETMKDHATAEQIKNYFAAQSLVDDVSAFHLSKDSQWGLKFLVIESFHSMFNDGVVERIKIRNPLSKVVNIEVIDASDYTQEELDQLMIDEKYGPRADFLIFVNEPTN